MRNYFTFDGVDSRSFGVYISGQGTFKAPARSYDAIEIPGKNGALLGIDSRLGNVELAYPAFIYSNFKENVAAFRAFLLSHKGYFKLKDSYHPDEYRMAYFPGPFEPDVTSANNAGSFDITFICKPQRYLESGQEVVELSPSTAQVETYTGNIVEIEPGIGDRVTGLTVPFIPIQDLHGYSHPWPAGGGKNKVLISSENDIGVLPIVHRTYDNGIITISGTSDSTNRNIYLQDVTPIIQSLGTATVSTYVFEPIINCSARINVQQGSTVLSRDDIIGTTRTYTYTEGYSYILLFHVKNVGDASAKFSVQIESGSTATAWEPYENICPISGRTGCEVYRTGKNLLDPSLLQVFNSKKYIRTVSYATQGTVKVQGDTSYALSRKSAMSDGKIYYYDAFGNPISDAIISATNPYYFTTPPNCATIGFYVAVDSSGSLNSPQDAEPQLELGSATAYEPYNGNTYAVDWTTEAGTVYGGTLDLVTGVLTVDWAMVDLGTLTWSYVNGIFVATLPNDSYKYTSSVNAISSCYTYVGVAQNGTVDMRDKTDGSFALHYNANYPTSRVVYVKNTAYTDAATFKTAMNGAQLVYELATPLTYQLTPHEITLIQNALNYIWSNAGPVTVEVTEGLRVTNPTLFDALPFLRVYGTGTLGMGSHTITITAADVYTDIDCEMMDCFKGSANKNQYVQFSGNDFPTLEPGVNGFSFSGITKVEVKPRWWSV